MFHNVLKATTVTQLSHTNEIDQWQNRPFTSIWPERIHKRNLRKRPLKRLVTYKLRRPRTNFSTEQLNVLEKVYTQFKYIDGESRSGLADSLNLQEKTIKVWFQNRRMKEKRKSSESSNSSSEVSHENFPSSTGTTETMASDSVELECNESDTIFSNGSNSQYQLPTFHTQGFPNQYCNDNTPGIPKQCPDFTTSHSESTRISEIAHGDNVYPTAYYPSSTDHHHNYSEDNYEHTNPMLTEYWSSNNFGLNYFQSPY